LKEYAHFRVETCSGRTLIDDLNGGDRISVKAG
jgi:hypothetical protein